MTTARGPQRADGWTAAVRQRLGLGRLLPLGGPADGAWIAETAAATVLRGATARPGTVLGKLRIGPTEEAVEAAVAGGRDASRDPAEPVPPPAPPNALPPVSLRIGAEFSTTPDRPLPDAAAALRAALLAAATARLGLEIAEVDLTVTALLEDDAADQVTAAETTPAARVAKPEGAVATAAAGVPGVVALTRVLGGPVHSAPDHVRVEVAVAGDHRALDVARSVRTAVAAALEDRLPVSVLVTDVVEPGSGS
ncbi:hypothetical protein OG890_07575 [Streptomyces anulatus]|uniref:hypothetical protein n=1 Tax=Streptomyces anulatus TaxID=1892 RepID=UPI002251818F|nr:hypothetical protein [Streptomyces anulatus]MCX4483802.1 hypothetical protein [Streptomyces anulatus]MCX4600291.1 hypothetical protein [Streptomyces anulatus]WSI76739.1 hypothetical protein OG557_07225 [Streptomyces anulatus]WSU72785.1 hypothetical protein OG499_07460 [Streptomyces anulatus]